MPVIRLPTGAERYDIEWCVGVGESVHAGQTLAWLCAPGRCGLEALVAPVSGVVTARWTSLLTWVPGGQAIASIGVGDEGMVREGEAKALAARREEVELEVRALRQQTGRSGAGAALIASDLTRLTRWLDAAREVANG
ncbi:MAG: hypothetical protein AB1938_10905 [Myxococcota bacterium]